MQEENFKVTRKEAQQLARIPGNVKGAVILANLEYVRQKGGKKAQEMIQKRLKELGYDISLQDIKPMNFYPEALSVLIILLAKEILKLDKAGIFEMGRLALKVSIFVEPLLRFFVSPLKCFQQAPRYWKKQLKVGELEAVKMDEEKKYAIIRVKGYKFHPLICDYHKGYFLQVAQTVLGKKNVEIEETKCVFKGDPYHEYIIRWQ